MERVVTLAVRGRGTLEVRRGPPGCALLVHGEPAVVATPDPDDPERVWLLRAHDTGEIEASLGDLDLTGDDPVAALDPVLGLLADGTWRVHVTDTPDVAPGPHGGKDAPGLAAGPLDWSGPLHLGGDEATLVGTVPRDLLPERRIAALVRAIRAGARPAVVALTTEDGATCCVVAGHAALEAWRRLGEPPLLVVIEALDPTPIDAHGMSEVLAAAQARIEQRVRAHVRAADRGDVRSR